MNKTIIVVIGAVMAVLLSTKLPEAKEMIRSVLYSSGAEHRVMLAGDGFTPNKLVIQQGDVVIFSTDTQREFWPASDQHPVHTVYPEFDPKRPLLSNETWSFTFDKVGTWSYHDHLHSFHGGTITVNE